MDFLYQYYVQQLEEFGASQALIIALWFLFPFLLTIIALIIVVILMIFIEQKVFLPFWQQKNNISQKLCNPETSIALNKDIYKLLPFGIDKALFVTASVFVFAPIIMAWGVIPYSNKYMPVSSGVNLLLFLSIMLLPVIGIMLIGIAGNNKSILVNTVRTSSLIISYEIPMMITVLGIVILSGSLNINDIILSQSITSGAIGWYFIPSFIGALVFFAGMLVQIKSFHIDFLSLKNDRNENNKKAIIKPITLVLAEYSAIFIMSLFFVCLFLGGYLPPFGFYLSEIYEFNYIFNTTAVYFEQTFWLISKAFVIAFILMWARLILPSFKATRTVKFAWKWLVPLSIVNIIIVCIVEYFSGGTQI